MNTKKYPARIWLAGGLVLTTFFSATPQVYAEGNNWTGFGGDNQWETPANWSLGSIPAEGQDVEITNGAQVYTQAISPPLATLHVRGDSTNLTQTGGSLDTTVMLVEGSGVWNEPGYMSNSPATYSLANGTLQAADVIVGQAAYGIFSQIDSTVTITDTLTLAMTSNGSGLYSMGSYSTTRDSATNTTSIETISGGTLQAGNIVIGNDNRQDYAFVPYYSEFSQIDSAVTVANTLTLGKEQGGWGSYSIGEDIRQGLIGEIYLGKASGGSLSAANVIIGDAGRGSFNQIDSSVNIADTLTLGKQQGGEGSYSLGQVISQWDDTTGSYIFSTATGGTLQASNTIIGDDGNGSFTQIDSTATFGTLTLGKQQEGHGSYSLGQIISQWDDTTGSSVFAGTATGGSLLAENVVIGDGVGYHENEYGGYFVPNDFRQFDSSVIISGTLTLGKQQEGYGSYSLGQVISQWNYTTFSSMIMGTATGGTLQANNAIIGDFGDGYFSQIDSSATFGTLTLGKQQEGYGSYDLGQIYWQWDDTTDKYIIKTATGGTLLATDTIIGDVGNGSFTQIDSTATFGTLTLGKQQEGYGSYSLGGSFSLWDDITGSYIFSTATGGTLKATNAIIGDEGQGSFNQIGSSVTFDTLTLGKQQGGYGSYSLGQIISQWDSTTGSNITSTATGGTLQATDTIIGDEGNGSFTQIDSTATFGTLTLGKQQEGHGSYSLGQIIWQWDDTKGSSVFAETATGGSLLAENVVIGDSAGYLENEYGGYFVSNDFRQFDSSVIISGTLTLGKQQGGYGFYSLGQFISQWDYTINSSVFVGTATGGTLQATNAIIGDEGRGAFNQIDSSATFGTLTLGKQHEGVGYYWLGQDISRRDDTTQSFVSTGTATGGTLQTTNAIIGDEGEGFFTQTNNSTTIDDTLTVARHNGSQGYVAIAGGTLDAAHIVVGVDGEGRFEQTGGTVTANTMTISSKSQVDLSGGSLLINDSLTNEGWLSLASADLLTVGNTFTNTGVLEIDLANYNGQNFITLLHSTADLDGELRIINSGGQSTEGIIFTLLYAEGELLGDLDFDNIMTDNLQGYRFDGMSRVGNALQLNLASLPSAVPAPSSLLLLSSALLMLARRRQRSIQ